MKTNSLASKTLLILACAGLVTGCNIQERIAWSPDGNQAMRS